MLSSFNKKEKGFREEEQKILSKKMFYQKLNTRKKFKDLKKKSKNTTKKNKKN